MPRKQVISLQIDEPYVVCDCSRPVYFAEPDAIYRIVVYDPDGDGKFNYISEIVEMAGAKLTRYIKQNREILLEGPFGKRQVRTLKTREAENVQT